MVLEDRYRIVRSIGLGGMGAVYEAEQVRVGRRCAIKFLHTELSGRSRSAVRFKREAQILGRLEHEHLTAVLDYGVYLERSPFLVMEYLDGCTLKSSLAQRGSLAAGDALGIIRQVAEGMAYVHAHGVVHRDLKPDNLMLLARSPRLPWVKILDFGIAREDDGRDITISGTDLGTVAYMSPEQARGAKAVQPSTDVFAIGTILYEALTGKRPHPGDSYNAVMFHLLTQKHAPLGRALPSCSPELEALVERCLEKEPRRRYQNAGDLLNAVRALSVSGEVTANVELPTAPARAHLARRFLRSARGFAPGMLIGAMVATGVNASTHAQRSDCRIKDTAAASDTVAAIQRLPLQEQPHETERSNPVSNRAPNASSPDVTVLAASANGGEPDSLRPPPAIPRLPRNRSPNIVPLRSAATTAPMPQSDANSAPSPPTEVGGEDVSPFVSINPYGAD
ncbi:MAG TPA: serine/threonine-protein kinase [Polyangiaceae bacterium]|nr:serine/threonine-protein kinase [Polyangiaceae bacterium]